MKTTEQTVFTIEEIADRFEARLLRERDDLRRDIEMHGVDNNPLVARRKDWIAGIEMAWLTFLPSASYETRDRLSDIIDPILYADTKAAS